MLLHINMYLNKLLTTIKDDPLAFTIGMCIIMLAVMGTSVRHVSSTMFTLVFLLSLPTLLSWPKVFSSLIKVEKIFLLSFVFYTASGLLAYFNADDASQYIKLLERYFRFLIAVPIFLLLIKKNKSLINYLYVGAALSGPFVFAVALIHYIADPEVPAKGYYHHIIFGQLAMLNVGILIAYLITNKLSRVMQALILTSMFLGITAAILSQARGVWVAFPIYIMIAVIYLLKNSRLKLKVVSILLLIAVTLIVLTPASELIKLRTESATSEIAAFYNDGKYISSVGTRLAMWEIAINVWEKHPILGTGPGDFDDEVRALQNSGKYIGMDVHNSAHNIYIQAMATSGVIGLLALIFVLLMPLMILLNKNNCEESAKLTGLIIVVSFAVFGVSESWVLRLSITSVFLIYTEVVVAHVVLASRHAQKYL